MYELREKGRIDIRGRNRLTEKVRAPEEASQVKIG